MPDKNMWSQIEAMKEFAQKELADHRGSSTCLDFWTQYRELADIHICEHDEMAWVNAFAYPLNSDGSTDTSGVFIQLF